jgi:hypothetical protein
MTEMHDPLNTLNEHISDLEALRHELEQEMLCNHDELRPQGPIVIKMKDGKGYDWLALTLNEEMKEYTAWKPINGASLKNRMQNILLQKNKEYRFEPEELIANGTLTGGLSPKEISKQQRALKQFKQQREMLPDITCDVKTDVAELKWNGFKVTVGWRGHATLKFSKNARVAIGADGRLKLSVYDEKLESWLSGKWSLSSDGTLSHSKLGNIPLNIRTKGIMAELALDLDEITIPITENVKWKAKLSITVTVTPEWSIEDWRRNCPGDFEVEPSESTYIRPYESQYGLDFESQSGNALDSPGLNIELHPDLILKGLFVSASITAVGGAIYLGGPVFALATVATLIVPGILD